jgi:hypothetical protein
MCADSLMGRLLAKSYLPRSFAETYLAKPFAESKLAFAECIALNELTISRSDSLQSAIL